MCTCTLRCPDLDKWKAFEALSRPDLHPPSLPFAVAGGVIGQSPGGRISRASIWEGEVAPTYPLQRECGGSARPHMTVARYLVMGRAGCAMLMRYAALQQQCRSALGRTTCPRQEDTEAAAPDFVAALSSSRWWLTGSWSVVADLGIPYQALVMAGWWSSSLHLLEARLPNRVDNGSASLRRYLVEGIVVTDLVSSLRIFRGKT